MAKQKKRRTWTVCYTLYRPEDDNPDNWYSNVWFAFGRDKTEAREDFMRYFERERENFYCGDMPGWEIHIDNIFEGWSC